MRIPTLVLAYFALAFLFFTNALFIHHMNVQNIENHQIILKGK